MSTRINFYNDLVEQGIILNLTHAGTLAVSGPPQAKTPETVELIRSHKSELVDWLKRESLARLDRLVADTLADVTRQQVFGVNHYTAFRHTQLYDEIWRLRYEWESIHREISAGRSRDIQRCMDILTRWATLWDRAFTLFESDHDGRDTALAELDKIVAA